MEGSIIIPRSWGSDDEREIYSFKGPSAVAIASADFFASSIDPLVLSNRICSINLYMLPFSTSFIIFLDYLSFK